MGQQVETIPRLPGNIERGPHEAFLAALVRSLLVAFQRIAERLNGALLKDGTEAMSAPLVLATYTIATLPAASGAAGAIVYVSDGSAGQKFRGSDGTSWVNLG